jgi:hypothetical protein
MRHIGILDGKGILSTEAGDPIPKARVATVRIKFNLIALRHMPIFSNQLKRQCF